jgi:hypothetical protein
MTSIGAKRLPGSQGNFQHGLSAIAPRRDGGHSGRHNGIGRNARKWVDTAPCHRRSSVRRHRKRQCRHGEQRQAKHIRTTKSVTSCWRWNVTRGAPGSPHRRPHWPASPQQLEHASESACISDSCATPPVRVKYAAWQSIRTERRVNKRLQGGDQCVSVRQPQHWRSRLTSQCSCLPIRRAVSFLASAQTNCPETKESAISGGMVCVHMPLVAVAASSAVGSTNIT